jgi:RNA polymerase-binding transcription factor DksA
VGTLGRVATTTDGVSGAESGIGDARTALDDVEADLGAVQAALARLDDGRYFSCVRCGRPLEPGALEADPLIDHCPDPCAER